MGHPGDELADGRQFFRLDELILRAPEVGQALLQVAHQARVLDGSRRLGGQGQQEVLVLLDEGVRQRRVDAEGADAPLAEEEGRHQHAGKGAHLPYAHKARVARDVGHVDHLAPLEGQPGDSVALAHLAATRGVGAHLTHEGERTRAQLAGLFVKQVQHAVGRTGDGVDGQPHDEAEEMLHVEGSGERLADAIQGIALAALPGKPLGQGQALEGRRAHRCDGSQQGQAGPSLSLASPEAGEGQPHGPGLHHERRSDQGVTAGGAEQRPQRIGSVPPFKAGLHRVDMSLAPPPGRIGQPREFGCACGHSPLDDHWSIAALLASQTNPTGEWRQRPADGVQQSMEHRRDVLSSGNGSDSI